MAVKIMSEQGNKPNEGLEAESSNKKETMSVYTLNDKEFNDDDKKFNDNVKEDIISTKKKPKDENLPTAKKEVLKKPWPLRNIKEPHENDVLYGRGGGTNHHPGNKLYRKMVEERKHAYITSKRLDKPLVALEIIRDWRSQDPPGRFLKQDESTGMWNDVGDKKAREKTSQALREKAPSTKQDRDNDNGDCSNDIDFDSSRGSFEHGLDLDSLSSSQGPVKRISPDRSSRPRMVGFSEPNGRINTSKKKLTRATLMRDHSLGCDYVNPDEAVSLEGFSWQEPLVDGAIGSNITRHRNGRKTHHHNRSRSNPNIGELGTDYVNNSDPFLRYPLSSTSGSGMERNYNRPHHPLRDGNGNQPASQDYIIREVDPPAPLPLHHHSGRSTSTSSQGVWVEGASQDLRYYPRSPPNSRMSPLPSEANDSHAVVASATRRSSPESSRRGIGDVDFEPESYNGPSPSNAPERMYRSYSPHPPSKQQPNDEYYRGGRHSDPNSWRRGSRGVSGGSSSNTLQSSPYDRMVPTSSVGSQSSSSYRRSEITPGSAANYHPYARDSFRNSSSASPHANSHRGDYTSYDSRRHSSSHDINRSLTKSASPNAHSSGERSNRPLLRQSSSFSQYEREKRIESFSDSDFDLLPFDAGASTHLPPVVAADLIDASSPSSLTYGRSKINRSRHDTTPNNNSAASRPSNVGDRDKSLGVFDDYVFGEDVNNSDAFIELPLPQAPVNIVRGLHSSQSLSSHKRRNTDTPIDHNKNSTLSRAKERPSHVKRATSNQNEEKETKKDTKIVKRAGLNREHSITAFKLREAYREKSSTTPDNNDSCKSIVNFDDVGHNDHHSTAPSVRPSNYLQRDHSLALNKLREASVGDRVSEAIFASLDEDAFDILDKSDEEEVKEVSVALVLDDDSVIRNLSHATNEIDLCQAATSPSNMEKKNNSTAIVKPKALTSAERMSTIEYIENELKSDDTEPNWFDLVEP